MDELARALGLTRTAVRAQLASLVRDGLVDQRESRLSEFVGAQLTKCCDRYERERCCFEVGLAERAAGALPTRIAENRQMV